TANRTGARSNLADLRVHRAGVDGARGHGRRRFAARQIFFRIGQELRAATGAAEVIRVPAVLGTMRRAMRVDLHAADQVGLVARTLRRGVTLPRGPLMLVMIVGHARSSLATYTLPGYIY